MVGQRIEFWLEFSRRKTEMIKMKYAAYRAYAYLINMNILLAPFLMSVKIYNNLDVEANFFEYNDVLEMKSKIVTYFQDYQKWTIYPSKNIWESLRQRTFLEKTYPELLSLTVSIINAPNNKRELYTILPGLENPEKRMPSEFLLMSDVNNYKIKNNPEITAIDNIVKNRLQSFIQKTAALNYVTNVNSLIKSISSQNQQLDNYLELTLMGLYKIGSLPGLVGWVQHQHPELKLTLPIPPPGILIAIKTPDKSLHSENMKKLFGNLYSIEVSFDNKDFIYPALFQNINGKLIRTLFSISIGDVGVVEVLSPMINDLCKKWYFLSSWCKLLLFKTGKLSHKTFHLEQFLKRSGDSIVEGKTAILKLTILLGRIKSDRF